MNDVSKIKPGDEVTVRGVVSPNGIIQYGEPCLSIVFDNKTNHCVPARNVVGHTPKALAVGDRVKLDYGGNEWRIEAIKGCWAWVFCDGSDSGDLVRVDRLERVS